VAGLSLLLLLTSSASPAAAAPRPDGTPNGVAVPAALTRGSAPVTITMITGDTVTYGTDSGGRATATVSPGPGRDQITFRGRTEGGDYYLVPSDAEPSLAAGLLDKRMFDLTYLAAGGYGDSATGELPVIVQYRQTAGLARQTLPSSSTTRSLPSVNGAAMRVAKKQAGAFWETVRGGAELGAGLGKLWLDGRVTVSDDVSDAQIGAPAAWAAGLDGTGMTVGIIDTGIDRTHPDLVGKVVAAQSFVPAGEPGGGNPADVTDRHGHGTHVASIVAGTGAASAGKYRGVAPNATFTIAKALDDSGSGSDSTIIAAMQWQAATEHARVVSMSLGSNVPTDGTDPLSQAVNDLTAQYGTLFVIAAGNSGPAAGTVAAPGAATSALTVGAVNSADQLANFSSRGPRAGDHAIKPEITGPGVAILAARAAGTSLGTPLDQYYTAASGTSMATPHVAAAAAILAQQHPEWTAEQLKLALVGSAHDIGATAFQQGAGRVDIARAISQQVFVDTASVSGNFVYPSTGATLTKAITYRNTGPAAVSLSLNVSLNGPDGKPAPAAVATIDQAALSVPAGATATVNLTIDPATAGPGLFSGRLRATDAAGDLLTVPIGMQAQAKQDTITVRVVGGSNRPIFPNSLSYLSALRVNDTVPELAEEPISTVAYGWRATGEPNTYETHIKLAEGGIYSLESQVSWRNLLSGRNQTTILTRPQVTLDHDLTVTFNIDEAAEIKYRTPRTSTPVTANLAWTRTTASGALYLSFFLASYPIVAEGGLWTMPSAAPTVGTFTLSIDETLIAPQATVTVRGRGQVELHPQYVVESNDIYPKFNKDQRLRVASEADLTAGRDVSGALVFVQPTTATGLIADLDLAVAAKAAGVLTDSPYASILSTSSQQRMAIPLLSIDLSDGARTRAVLDGVTQARADIHPELDSPYEYKLNYFLRGRIPSSLTISPREQDLTQLRTTYHAEYPPTAGRWGNRTDVIEVSHTFLGDQRLSIKGSHNFTGHRDRVDYYNTTGSDVLWLRLNEFLDDKGQLRIEDSYRGFTRAGVGQEDWNQPSLPSTPTVGPQFPTSFATALNFPCDGCRQGDTLRVRSLSAFGLGQYSGAADPSHHIQDDNAVEETHLYQGGTELPPQSDLAGLTYYSLPAATGTYRLTDTYHNGSAGQRLAKTVDTTWTFHSGRPTVNAVKAPYACIDTLLFGSTEPCVSQPLLFPSYDLGLAPDDTAPAGQLYDFTVSVAGAARVAGLRLWTSADDGVHWRQALVIPGGGNTYEVIVRNPRLADAPLGTVTIKLEAWDTAGNSVQQTIHSAYGISSR
jgi:hypothetical protein